ncbi:MAG TPA: DUF1326 domain-containing protein [Candidatus Limnocylindria bacterium]|nr:DUF1326 domain-containing protein [Candidatus Limnocylindria bacterium]
MAYAVEGRLLEVCSCNVLCPCWIGEDPDGGTCDSALAWHIDDGQVDGVDVSGLTLALSVHIPGNVLKGNWKAAVLVDDQASDEQQEAMLKLFTGQLGGAIADLAGLIGEVVAVERVPITFTVEEGKGTFKLGSVASAELHGYAGATGKPTVMSETVFSTIPGSPVYVAKSAHFERDGTEHGLPSVAISGRNALQGHFRFES